MGCDIHSFVEINWVPFKEDVFSTHYGSFTMSPFDWGSYSIFGFLAGVRNYSCCTPISEPKGLPSDSEYLKRHYARDDGYHSHSFLTVKELIDFDYDQKFWDRRITRTTVLPNGGVSSNGAALAEEGEGETITYREHLGKGFFEDLDVLKTLGEPENVRVLFWFDN